VGALTADRETTAMTKTAVRTKVHETLDAHGDFATKITFDLKVSFHHIANPTDLLFVEIVRLGRSRNSGLIDDRFRGVAPDPIDIGQGNIDALTARKVNTCKTCHRETPKFLALPLLVARVCADHSDDILASDDFAFWAHLLDG